MFALRHRAPKMLTQYSLRKKFSQDYKFCDSSIFENFAGIWIHDLQIMQIQFFEYDENLISNCGKNCESHEGKKNVIF